MSSLARFFSQVVGRSFWMCSIAMAGAIHIGRSQVFKILVSPHRDTAW